MTAILGLAFAVVFLGACAKFTHTVWSEARAAGVFDSTPKGVPGMAQRVKITAQRAPARARELARRIPVAPRAKTTRSKDGAGSTTHIPWNERIWGRLIVPGQRKAADPPAPAPASPTPAVVPAAGVADLAAARAARAAPPQNGTRPVSPTSPAAPPADLSGGPAMTATVSADFLSALTRVTAGATSGGIRDKIRTALLMAEGFGQQAAALEQYARALQETGLYPASVWEPVMQAAGACRVAAASLNESGTVISSIAQTPAGELGSRAPHRDELVRN